MQRSIMMNVPAVRPSTLVRASSQRFSAACARGAVAYYTLLSLIPLLILLLIALSHVTDQARLRFVALTARDQSRPATQRAGDRTG